MRKFQNIFIGLMAMVLVSIFLIGCKTKKDYQTEYVLKKDGHLNVTIKGKAANLGVVLVLPDGETKVETIAKEEMIDNTETVSFWLDEEEIKEGIYTILVKTLEPEKVVCKKEISFKRGKVSIEDIKVVFREPYAGRRGLDKFEIKVKNEGTLPISFSKIFIEIGNQLNTESKWVSLALPGDGNLEVNTFGWVGERSFLPGNYPVEVKLYLARKEGEFIAFSKEINVPSEELTEEKIKEKAEVVEKLRKMNVEAAGIRVKTAAKRILQEMEQSEAEENQSKEIWAGTYVGRYKPSENVITFRKDGNYEFKMSLYIEKGIWKIKGQRLILLNDVDVDRSYPTEGKIIKKTIYLGSAEIAFEKQ